MIDKFPFFIDRVISEGIMSIFGYNSMLVFLFFSMMLVFFGIALRVSNMVIIISLLFFLFVIASPLVPSWFLIAIALGIGIFLGLVLILWLVGR